MTNLKYKQLRIYKLILFTTYQRARVRWLKNNMPIGCYATFVSNVQYFCCGLAETHETEINISLHNCQSWTLKKLKILLSTT